MFDFLKKKKDDDGFDVHASESSDDSGLDTLMPGPQPIGPLSPGIGFSDRDIQLILARIELINRKLEDVDRKLNEVLQIARESK